MQGVRLRVSIKRVSLAFNFFALLPNVRNGPPVNFPRRPEGADPLGDAASASHPSPSPQAAQLLDLEKKKLEAAIEVLFGPASLPSRLTRTVLRHAVASSSTPAAAAAVGDPPAAGPRPLAPSPSTSSGGGHASNNSKKFAHSAPLTAAAASSTHRGSTGNSSSSGSRSRNTGAGSRRLLQRAARATGLVRLSAWLLQFLSLSFLSTMKKTRLYQTFFLGHWYDPAVDPLPMTRFLVVSVCDLQASVRPLCVVCQR